jgi:simple sugar transport system permease protein
MGEFLKWYGVALAVGSLLACLAGAGIHMRARRKGQPPHARDWFHFYARPVLGVFLVLTIGLLITYKVYSGDFESLKDHSGYKSVIMINLLVGISILLFIIELKWDALRVVLTVAVALVFGYVVTALFNLDAADRYIEGRAKIKIQTEAQPFLDIAYGPSTLPKSTDIAEQPEASYQFAGRADTPVTVLAYADDSAEGIDMQVEVLGPDGQVIAEGTTATAAQVDDYNLTSENDAAVDITLPADGFYTVHAFPETEGGTGEYKVKLVSASNAPVNIGYGDERETNFNDPKAADAIESETYHFGGHAGDVVSILGYNSQANADMELQLALIGPDGSELASNEGANAEQLQTFRRDLKSKNDAVLDTITLPSDGIYTLQFEPQSVPFGVQVRETLGSTRKAYSVFLMGPLSRPNRWSTFWIRDALLLIMLGLAVSIVFRANQFSLGAEGQMYFGALASGVITLSFGDLPAAVLVPVAVLSAMTAGFLWGLVPGILKAYLGANELVSTLMLNTVATSFYDLVLIHQLKDPKAGFNATEYISEAGRLHPIVDFSGERVTIAIYFVIVAVILTWLLIQRTPIGYEIRMIGANIKFANYGGVNTKRTIMLAMAISGAVAGLAGSYLVMDVHHHLLTPLTVGLAFEGVVVALLARNDPLVVPFTGLLYQYLRAGARVMESDTDVSFEVVRIIQAMIILLITAEALVTLFQKRRVRRRGTLDVEAPPSTHLMPPQSQAEEGTANV